MKKIESGRPSKGPIKRQPKTVARNAGLPKKRPYNKEQPMAPSATQRMPSQETIDKNSTKGRMGEGKVDTVGAIVKGAVKAATKMGESMKRIVDISTNRTTKVKMENAKRAAEIQAPQDMGPNLRKKK